MSKYKHILWDWNGTLLDDTWLSVDIINQLLAKYAKPLISLETYREIFDFPVINYYSRLGFDFTQTPFKMVGAEYIHQYFNRWRECRLRENAREALEFISHARIRQSILSAASQALIQEGVQYFCISDFFMELAGLDNNYAPGKKDIAGHLMRRIAADPQHILLIGDTTHDHEVAKEIGMDCILLTGGHHSVEKLRLCRVPLIDSLAQLREVL